MVHVPVAGFDTLSASVTVFDWKGKETAGFVPFGLQQRNVATCPGMRMVRAVKIANIFG